MGHHLTKEQQAEFKPVFAEWFALLDTTGAGTITEAEYIEGCTKLAQSSLESLEVNWDELERDYHAEVTKIHRDAEGRISYADLERFTIGHWFEQSELNKKRDHPVTWEAWLKTVKHEVANLRRVRQAGSSADISSPELRRRALLKQSSPASSPSSSKKSPLRSGVSAGGTLSGSASPGRS